MPMVHIIGLYTYRYHCREHDEDQSVLEKRITAFFTGIEVDGLSPEM